jgi:hypothetical protein
MHNHGKNTRRALTILTLALAPACAPLTPPAQNSGAVRSHEGVVLALTGQSCSQTTETDEPSWDLVEQRLAVEIRNGSPEPLTVRRDQFQLLLPDGSALQTMTWEATDPVSLESGQSHTFKLRFMMRSEFTCQTAMRFDAGRGVSLGGHSVALAGVSFVPRQAL